LKSVNVNVSKVVPVNTALTKPVVAAAVASGMNGKSTVSKVTRTSTGEKLRSITNVMMSASDVGSLARLKLSPSASGFDGSAKVPE
jgi:hypothetical protein